MRPRCSLKYSSPSPDGAKWYEAVKLVLDEQGNEAFPAPTSWGLLGFTEKDEAEAEKRYAGLVEEYGAAVVHPVDKADFVQPDTSPVPPPKFAHILPVNPPPSPTADSIKTGKTRGRKKLDVELKIPDSGTFQARELAADSGMSVPFVHNRLKNLVADGVIEVHDRVQGKRGKPIILFKKKGAAA